MNWLVAGLVLAAVDAVCTAAVVAIIVRADREPLADLDPEPEPHDAAECEVCQWADDLGVVWAIDWSLWAAEMQEPAS